MDRATMLKQFRELTGSAPDAATSMLEAFDWNLEPAVEFFLDNPGSAQLVNPAPSTAATAPPSRAERRGGEGGRNIRQYQPTAHQEQSRNGNFEREGRSYSNTAMVNDEYDEDGIRAPIPSRMTKIMDDGPAYDMSAMYQGERRNFGEIVASQSIRHPFRNFGQESNPRSRDKDNLASMFRPPTEIMFTGTFQEAKNLGESTQRWLLVNIQQSEEFLCLVLDRDLWKNATVTELIKQHFVFWQMNVSTPEGQGFKQIYRSENFPYVAIIDPRTGQTKRLFDNLFNLKRDRSMDTEPFLLELKTFLQQNPFEVPQQKAPDMLYQDEEAQIAAAIAASMEDAESTRGQNTSSRAKKSRILIVDSDSDNFTEEDGSDFSSSSEESSDESIGQKRPKRKTNNKAATSSSSSSSALSSSSSSSLKTSSSSSSSSSSTAKPATTTTTTTTTSSAPIKSSSTISSAVDTTRANGGKSGDNQGDRNNGCLKNNNTTSNQQIISVDEPPSTAPPGDVTRLQIRMIDGSKIVRKFFRKNLVAHVFAFVKSKTELESFEIMLFTDKLSPKKEQSLEEAGLLNSVVNVIEE